MGLGLWPTETPLRQIRQSALKQRKAGGDPGTDYYEAVLVYVDTPTNPTTMPSPPGQDPYIAENLLIGWENLTQVALDPTTPRTYSKRFPAGTVDRGDPNFTEMMQLIANNLYAMPGGTRVELETGTPTSQLTGAHLALWLRRGFFSGGYFARTYVMRSRYRSNAASGDSPPPATGFTISGHIWANKFSGGHGWDTSGGIFPNGLNFTRYTLENVVLLTTRTGHPPNNWVYLEPPFGPQLANTFNQGYVGQIILGVDYETPAQWTARTGIAMGSGIITVDPPVTGGTSRLTEDGITRITEDGTTRILE